MASSRVCIQQPPGREVGCEPRWMLEQPPQSPPSLCISFALLRYFPFLLPFPFFSPAHRKLSVVTAASSRRAETRCVCCFPQPCQRLNWLQLQKGLFRREESTSALEFWSPNLWFSRVLYMYFQLNQLFYLPLHNTGNSFISGNKMHINDIWKKLCFLKSLFPLPESFIFCFQFIVLKWLVFWVRAQEKNM